jgi:hypothetical protein
VKTFRVEFLVDEVKSFTHVGSRNAVQAREFVKSVHMPYSDLIITGVFQVRVETKPDVDVDDPKEKPRERRRTLGGY